MRILIDSQYKTIYRGEFKDWVEDNILKRFSENNDIDLGKSLDDCEKLLMANEYDLVIVTGYDYRILGLISSKSKTKVASIIYEMNAENLISTIDDKGYLGDIIAFKSRLIFLSTFILCHNKTCHKQIVELYSSYPNFNIESKIVDVDFLCDFNKFSENRQRIAQGKYIAIKESINGATLLTQEFEEFIDNIVLYANCIPDSLYFIIICEKFPEKAWHKIKNNGLSELFKIVKDVSEDELNSIYANSVATLFLSSLDANINELCKAIMCKSICLINSENDVLCNFMENAANAIEISNEYNIIEDFVEIMRTSKDLKDKLKNMQIEHIKNKISNASQSISIKMYF